MVDTITLGELKWHHITNPTVEDLDFLRDNFHFHPLDIDDCSSFVQRPKIDIYDDYFFLVLHFPTLEKRTNLIKTEETKIFWGKNFLITVGNSHYVVQDLFNLIKLDPEEAEEDDLPISSDTILYKTLYRMMKESYLLLERMGSEIDIINRELFSAKSDKIIEEMSRFRKNIIHVNTIFRPQLRLFHKFESGEIKGFIEDMEDYWGNILDFYQKMWDMVEDYGELLWGLSNTFDSFMANRTNEVMRVLTIISTIVLPLMFLTGLYGMNVKLPIEELPSAFWILILLCVVLAFSLLLIFKRKRWM